MNDFFVFLINFELDAVLENIRIIISSWKNMIICFYMYM